LGKTIQVVAFLASLYYSKVIGPGVPNIIVCPATVMKQWVQEFHKWWPCIRVAILHSSGCAIKKARKKTDSDDEYQDEAQVDDDIGYLDDDQVDEIWGRSRKGKNKAQKKKKLSILGTRAGKNAAALVDEFIKVGGVLVTTYSGVKTYRDVLLKHKWGYVVLDEGHHIRNPDTETSILVKRFKVMHLVD
jgi:DNA excision repair protein ERCC-6